MVENVISQCGVELEWLPKVHMFECLIPSGAIWEALLEEACCWGWALRFQESTKCPVSLSTACLQIRM